MAEEQNKVEIEINNNEPIIDITINSPKSDNALISDNTSVSSPVPGPSGIGVTKRNVEINNNEITNDTNNDSDPINDDNSAGSSPDAGPSETGIIKRKNWIKCDICNVFVSSPKLLQVHLAGKRHNLIARKMNEQPRVYKCDLCDIKANSEKQLADHFASNKHKGRIEMLRRAEDIKFYCTYGTVAIILAWILISYVFYFIFMLTE